MKNATWAAVFAWAFAVHPLHAGALADKAAAATARGDSFVEGSDGWRFLPADLRFCDRLAAPDIESTVAPVVSVIADFSAQLKAAGIALVVVPVPPKALVHGAALDVSNEEKQKMQAGWGKVLADLGLQGVQTVDLLPDYLAAAEPMFCRRDTHWSGPGIDAALARFLPTLQAAGVATKTADFPPPDWKEVQINGDLGGPSENVKLRVRGDLFPPDIECPVVLLGDSHVLVFHQGGEMHTTGAGLPEQMAGALGSAPDVIGVRGSGATSSRMQLFRRLRSTPGFLAGKKAVVWVFAAREFTEADMWKKVSIFGDKRAP